MKVACMVLGCYAPQVLALTIPVFKSSGWDIFIHVDAKIDIKGYISHLGENASGCTFVDPIEVYWGGYSMLEAELRLIEAARTKGDYEKYLLISDDTLPVYPPDYLNQVLSQKSDLITAIKRPLEKSNYSKFFYYDHPATTMRGHGHRSTEIDDTFLNAMQEITHLKLTGKKQLTIAYGSQFWALTKDTLDFVTDIWSKDINLVKSFTYSPLPDETMIQSILHSYKFFRDIDLQPIYADFHSQNGGPRILESIEDLPFDLTSNQIFVRKVKPNALKFIETVTSRLLYGKNAWGSFLRVKNEISYLIDENNESQQIATMQLSAACY